MFTEKEREERERERRQYPALLPPLSIFANGEREKERDRENFAPLPLKIRSLFLEPQPLQLSFPNALPCANSLSRLFAPPKLIMLNYVKQGSIISI